MRGTKPQIRIERDPIGEMPAPEWMSDDARAEWERIVPILAQRKILTSADIGSLENYCIAMGQVREMDRIIQRQCAVQMVYKVDKDGNSLLVSTRRHPAVSVQSDAMTRARLLAAELGATPVSRSRPTVGDDEGDDDLFGWDGV
jgi:P27 family predicted phage terminase small subunit